MVRIREIFSHTVLTRNCPAFFILTILKSCYFLIFLRLILIDTPLNLFNQKTPIRRQGIIRFRKNSFLLLEVIIAFFLVVMCIIPLIAPHTFILTEQKKFIHQIELDHVVNLAFADIVQRLYRNEISWNDIAEKRDLEIDDSLLKRIKLEKPFPYKGTYSFQEIKHKPASETAKRKLYLYNLNMKFTPKNEDKKDKNGEIIGTLKYHYEIFLIRDLEEQKA